MSEVSNEVFVEVPVKSTDEVREDDLVQAEGPRGYRPPHLPTFGSKTPKVRKAEKCLDWFCAGCWSFILIGWVIVMVVNQVFELNLMVSEEEIRELEGKGEDPGETSLIKLSVVAFLLSLCYCACSMPAEAETESVFYFRHKILSETDFHTELGRIKKLRPELAVSVKCYHEIRVDNSNMEVTTFSTSEAQNVIDFVDVSPIVHFKKGKSKRFVCVNFKYEFESLDEATENEFRQLKDDIKNVYGNEDKLIRISDDYNVPGWVTTEDIMVDREPTKAIPCWVRKLGCMGCCSRLICCWCPWLLWLNSNMEFIEYPNKKLLCSTPIDEEYKEYIESERENYSINV